MIKCLFFITFYSHSFKFWLLYMNILVNNMKLKYIHRILSNKMK